ncbi:MAG: hypothetical protein WDZ49_03545 [Litorilinea sp.]
MADKLYSAQARTGDREDTPAAGAGDPVMPALPPLWRDSCFWLTLAFTIFAGGPFLLPGYFWGANDARHHVYFLFEYDRLVQDGIWWPRWSPDFAFGYGYPFFNIYGPLSHFLAELLLHFLNVEHTAAIKSIFVLSIVGSAATMYAFVRSWGGAQAAVISALVYVYMPYHLLNLYVRANLAESMAFVWLPLILWGARQAILRPSMRWLTTLAVGYAGLIFTSNLVWVLFTPWLGLYMAALLVIHHTPTRAGAQSWRAQIGQWVKAAIVPGLGIGAGLGLAAIFWIPMALERQYVRVDQWFDGRYDYRGHFVEFFQLFSPRWEFGVSTIGPDDSVGFQIGAVALTLALLGVLSAWTAAGRLRWEILAWGVAAVGATFLSLSASAPLWDLPVVGGILGFAQFPWRWLVIPTLFISLLAGLVALPLGRLRTNAYRVAGLDVPLLALCLVIVLGSYGLLRVENVEPAEGPVSLAGLMRFQASSDEMTGSTAWVKEIPTWSRMAQYYIDQDEAGEPVRPVESLIDYSIVDYNRETGFVIDSVAHSAVMEEVFYWSPLPDRHIVYEHFYYPGWRAYLLDERHGTPVQELPVIPETTGTLGRMTVPVPVGEGHVLLRFEDTPPRIVGRAVTWFTIVAMLVAAGLLAWRRRRKPV